MEKFLYQRLDEKNPKINMWFIYPAIESFAMASLGYLAIYKDLDLNPDIFVERVYTDTKTTLLNPRDVDAIAFSVSFEMDIFNIIKIFDKYNIEKKASNRKEDDPIIYAGGPVMMSNPKPYEEFFDFITIGEKIAQKEISNVLKDKRTKKRDEILKLLSEIEGVYVPKYKKEKIKIARDDLNEEIIYTTILSDKSFFQNTFIVEIGRGCPKMCNFCLASWLNIPWRYPPYEKIIEALEKGLKYTNKIALLGAYVQGHPRFDDIIKYIAKRCEKEDIELSISSLRADLADIGLIETLVKCNQKTATIALEAGSQRLRDFIKKDLSEEQILKTIETAFKGGLKGLKIYVMIGLPTEGDNDIEELYELAKKMKSKIKELAKKSSNKHFEITLSASTYIPKAHTPFENFKRFDNKTLEKRINFLKKNLHKEGINFRVSSIEWDNFQAILSICEEDLSDFLIDTVKNGANLGAFKKTLREYIKRGLLDETVLHQKAPFNDTKVHSWNFIDTGANQLIKKRLDILVSDLEHIGSV